MARGQNRRRPNQKGRYVIILLLVCCVLVFAVGLISRKRSEKFEDTMSGAVSSATDTSASETSEPTDSTVDSQTDSAAEPTQSTAASTEGDTASQTDAPMDAASFTADTEHLYIRVNREKQITLSLDAGTDVRWSVSDENVAMVDENGVVTGLQQGECIVSAARGIEVLEIPVTVRVLSVQDECTYVDGILIANKSYSLPESYDPGLLPETEDAFAQLSADAAAAGLDIHASSDYRSYSFQVEVYNSMVDAYGKEYADSVSARPGFSEHQTGYTIDCNSIDNTFAETAEGKWLAEHCWEYGFIIRYPEGKEAITGYDYESWHIRYVGVDHARAIWEQGLTLEEYLDIDSVYAD